MDDLRLRGEAGVALAHLVRELAADGELDEADLARIGEAMGRERDRIAVEKSWADRAHIHDEPHVPVVTTIPTEGVDEADWPEDVDASGMICHDCQRALVSDVGSTRLLICPQLHGCRPAHLVPAEHGAVECGQPRQE